MKKMEAPLIGQNTFGSSQLRYGFRKQSECNDVFFLLVFVGTIIMTVVFAGKYGPDLLSEAKGLAVNEVSAHNKVANLVGELAGVSIAISIVMALLLLKVAGLMINTALLCCCAVLGTMAYYSQHILCIQEHEPASYCWWPCALLSVLAGLVAVYTLCIQKRIAFASANLSVSSTAVSHSPGLFLVAVFMVLVQFAWVFTWMVATYGLYRFEYGGNDVQQDYSDKSKIAGMVIGMLFVLHWGMAVNNGIIVVCSSGVVGSWWLDEHASSFVSFLRAVTLSLGSICTGALFTSILETILDVLRFLQWQAQKSKNCIAVCFLSVFSRLVGCMESIVKFFNKYAFVYAGLFGYSYFTSAKEACGLFEKRGLSAVINQQLVWTVLTMTCLLVGACMALFGVVLARENQDILGAAYTETEAEAALGLAGFVMGYAMSSVLTSVLSASVATVFVCFAEDPEALSYSHSNAHAKLASAWQSFHPSAYQKIKSVNGAEGHA